MWASPVRRGLIRQWGTPANAAARQSTARCASAVSASYTLPSFTLLATSEAGLQAVAAALAADRRPGDAYLLHGVVGAGKSTFSRAFIRSAAEDPRLTVPSPTFLLQLVYDEADGPPIHHYDLYRLSDASDMRRLGLQQAFAEAVVLVEWPERLQPRMQLPASRVDVLIEPLGADEQAAYERSHAAAAQAPGAQAPGVGAGCLGAGSSGRTCGGAAAAAAAAGSAAEASASTEAAPWSAGTAVELGSSEDEEHGEYADLRWRRVCLQPVGEPWQLRIEAALRRLQATQPSRHGVVVLGG